MSGFKRIFKNFIYKILFILFSCFGIAFINWLIVRFISSYCYPSGLFGPIISMFTIGSPICHTLNTLQLRLTEQYIIIITSIITVIIANCNFINNNES